MLDDEPLPVADECRELGQRLAREAEGSPGVDLAPQEIREAEGIERIALDRCGTVLFAGAGRDIAVHRVDRVPPGEEVLDEQALPPLHRNSDLGRLAKSGKGLPEPLEAGPVVRDSHLKRRPAPGVEGVDLVVLLAPVEPHEDVHRLPSG